MGVKNALQGTKMVNAWYQKFKPKEYDDVKIIWLVTAPPGLFLTKKPLGSINDLRGLKIRAPGDSGKIVNAMGAVPVSVPPTDLYDGLQRGVIDGVNMTPECLKGWKLADLIRGMQENPGIGHVDANGVVMNKQKWNSLPPDIQQIIDRINEEWTEKAGRTWDEMDKEGRELGISKGLKVFKIPPEEARISVEKMKPLLDAYVKRMKEKGLPGEESLKFCQDYLKSHP
jgi:TRAP-type C4-dicarboxylate transport system substrate-binding protein